jgi:hypothetical protein
MSGRHPIGAGRRVVLSRSRMFGLPLIQLALGINRLLMERHAFLAVALLEVDCNFLQVLIELARLV